MLRFAFLDFGFPAGITITFALLAIFVFEVTMFVHAIRNKALSRIARVLWIVGMLIFHPIVAIVYYFTDYKKG